MSVEEISSLLKAENNKKKDEWEKVRMICFYSSQLAKTPEELFKLPWDKKTVKQKSKLTPDRAKSTAKQLEARLNGNKQGL